MGYCNFKHLDNNHYTCEQCGQEWIDTNNIGKSPIRWCGTIDVSLEQLNRVQEKILERNERMEEKRLENIENNIDSFPSITSRVKSYIVDRDIWVAAGKPMRAHDRMLDIYNSFCSKCPHYLTTGYACDICGCYINKGTFMNKLAWATTRCPDVPPLWIEENPFKPEKEPENLPKPDIVPLEEMPPPLPPEETIQQVAPNAGGSCCGG